MKAIRVPGKRRHDFKVVEDTEATLINFSIIIYNHTDKEQLSHDTDKIPLDQNVNPSK